MQAEEAFRVDMRTILILSVAAHLTSKRIFCQGLDRQIVLISKSIVDKYSIKGS